MLSSSELLSKFILIQNYFFLENLFQWERLQSRNILLDCRRTDLLRVSPNYSSFTGIYFHCFCVLDSGMDLKKFFKISLFSIRLWISCRRSKKARKKVQQNKKTDFWDVWEVPERFVCEHGKTVSEPRLSPCWTDETVTCWIARPREKTIAVKVW